MAFTCQGCGHLTIYGPLCVTCSATNEVAVYKRAREASVAMVEAQRLADVVVEAAINWHKSDMDESMDAAQTLEDAIEALIEFRRKMSIVKSRD